MSTATRDEPLRLTLACLPFAVLLGVALAAARHTVRRTPASGQES